MNVLKPVVTVDAVRPNRGKRNGASAWVGFGNPDFSLAVSSSETVSIFDNGMDLERVDWIRDGVINALAYPRATAAAFDAPVAVAADNVLMTGGNSDLEAMIGETERGL